MKCEDVLSRLRRDFPFVARTYGVRRIGVFGSVARGEAGPDSDVDLVVELERPDLFLMVHLKEHLGDPLGAPVDLLRYRDSLEAGLKDHLEREAIYA